MPIKVGQTFFLSVDAFEPEEHDGNEEGGQPNGEMQVASGDGLDDCDVGVVGHCLG